jgi:hypothetical protein
MQDLFHLVYASGATRDLTAVELDALLVSSQQKNARSGISGILLYSKGSFFQVLEGTRAEVDATFARIGGDSRHSHTTCIIREPIAARSFEAWTMGYAPLSEADAQTIVGFNDFYGARSCLQSLNPGRARKLLQAFATGRWHTPIQRTVVDSDVYSQAVGSS